VFVSKSLCNTANIITKYQIVFLRENSLEFILAIAKATYFSIILEEDSTFLLWNLRVLLVFETNSDHGQGR